MEQSRTAYEKRDENVHKDWFLSVTLIMQRVKRIRIQYYWVFRRHTLGGHTHFHSHMQISAHCVLQADRREFHFQAVRAHQELSSACVHVWVCPAPRSCHNIFWPAESVMPELMCYTLNVRRSPEHLVTLLSREVSSLSASGCITAGCQTMWLQQAEINDLMLGIKNEHLSKRRGTGGCREVTKDVIWEGQRANHGDLWASTQTVFTERLVMGESIDPLI